MEKNGFELEQALAFNLNRTASLMADAVSAAFSANNHRISAQDFGILYRLSMKGATAQAEITQAMMRDKATVTRRLDSLVKKGLIERIPDANDRRRFRIALTQQGEETLAATLPLLRDLQHKVQSGLSEEEKAMTLYCLQHIGNQLLDMTNAR